MRKAKEELEKKKKKAMPSKVMISIRLPVQMYRILRVYCERRGLSASEVIRRALDMYFDYERERGRV
jgi:Arc/MetJ-type ribon-helix-helix transcriptional regulator